MQNLPIHVYGWVLFQLCRQIPVKSVGNSQHSQHKPTSRVDRRGKQKTRTTYLTIIKQVEKQTKTKIFDDDREVLPDVLKKAKDKALVDTFDTE